MTHGSVAKMIAGLTLTSPKYEHSTALLKDRFEELHKLVYTHLQAHVGFPSPYTPPIFLKHSMMPQKDMSEVTHYLGNHLVYAVTC